jgi:hypothetical protein
MNSGTTSVQLDQAGLVIVGACVGFWLLLVLLGMGPMRAFGLTTAIIALGVDAFLVGMAVGLVPDDGSSVSERWTYGLACVFLVWMGMATFRED